MLMLVGIFSICQASKLENIYNELLEAVDLIVTKIQIDNDQCPIGLVLAKYYSRPSGKRSARAYLENELQKNE